MIKARVIAKTMPVVEDIPGADELIAYCARVSNPNNQDNHNTSDRLMAYCARHGHWSIFEMVTIVVEVEAPRDITRQLLRHRSMHFQEFSQRYAVPDLAKSSLRELRMQHPTNRQASTECSDSELIEGWSFDQQQLLRFAGQLQKEWLKQGAAKEVVRVLLPEGLTMSRLYANATVRDWWHYCQVRIGNGTQLEHADLATKINEAIEAQIPTTWQALKSSLPSPA